MIDRSPEVPREYFLNCSETDKQVKVACLKAAGEEVVVNVVTGAVFYGAAKGLGLLGASAISMTKAVAPVAAGVVIIGGVGYGILKAIESADKSCRKNNETALKAAWMVYASYHDKDLANAYKRTNTCARFLSLARRKTQTILGDIQKKKRIQERYEAERKLTDEESDPAKKERLLWRLSRTYPEFKRKLNKQEKRFLAALEKIRKQKPFSKADEQDKKEDIEGSIARLKRRYQCSSGQYLAELACGSIAAIGSMVTGGVSVAVGKKMIEKRIHQIAWERKLKLSTDEKLALIKAREISGKPLTQEQKEAIIKSHRVGRGQPGKNGNPASVGNYTREQLMEKSRILKQAGFSKEQRNLLIRNGVVGDRRGPLEHPGNPLLDNHRPPGTHSLTGKLKKSSKSDGHILFMESLNRGMMTEPVRYVSFTKKNGKNISGKVISFDTDRVLIQTPDGKKYMIKGDDLDSVQVIRPKERFGSSGTLFSETRSQSEQGSTAKVVGSYQQFYLDGSKEIHAEMTNPYNRVFVSETKTIINSRLKNLGVNPGNLNMNNPEDRKKLYDIWYKDIVPKIEDKAWGSREYGHLRDLIVNENNGSTAVGEIALNQAAVCSELSICASLVFAEYGIRSQVVTGTLTKEGGRHAWLEILSKEKEGGILEIIDSNYTREAHRSYQDYLEKFTRKSHEPEDIARIRSNDVLVEGAALIVMPE